MCCWVKSKEDDHWFLECLQCGDSEYTDEEGIKDWGNTPLKDKD